MAKSAPSYGWQAIFFKFRIFWVDLISNSETNDFMFYAYVLESEVKLGEYYRGHAVNLKTRLAEHNAGKCSHTTKFKPWKVKFYAAFETLALAQGFEKYLKSGSGHEFARRHLGLCRITSANVEAAKS